MKCVTAADLQTMSHIISDSCPLTKLDAGLQRQHTADEAAVDGSVTMTIETSTNTCA